MRIVRFRHGGSVRYGALEDGTVRVLDGDPFDAVRPSGDSLPLDSVDLLAPVDRPRVFGVGFNYGEHVKESGAKLPEIPTLFMKPSTAVVGPDAPIVLPREAQETHFEGELAAVIGRRARRVPEAEAMGVVLGLTCANDVSERSIQFKEMEMGCLLIGKGFDSFCPLGPAIATGVDPSDLALVTRVNGVRRQASRTRHLVFPLPRLVSWISRAVTLLPGDVILTGTPEGVGPLAAGDVVEVEIEGVGTLRNPVVREP